MLNKKDAIRINEEIGEDGSFINESSLEYALIISKTKKSWLYELSYILRALLVDHCFKDGNKRTSLIITTLFLDEKKQEYDVQLLIKAIHRIARKNINNPKIISGLIKNVITR